MLLTMQTIECRIFTECVEAGQVTSSFIEREFKEEEARQYPNKICVYQRKVICGDCLVDIGVSLD